MRGTTNDAARTLSDPARLAALAQTGLMGGESKPTLDRFVRIGRTAVGAFVAAVSLIDDQCQFFASSLGLPDPSARTLPLSHSFCRTVVITHEPLVFDDALEQPDVKDHPAVSDLGVRAYAGFPIRTYDGFVLGSFCAIRDQPHPWNEAELSILQDLATSVGAEIDLIRRARRAEASERRLADANVSLLKEAEPARRTRGVIHDLATPLNVLCLGLEHLESHDGVHQLPEVLDTILLLRRSAQHATAVLTEGRRPTSSPTRLDVAALLREVCGDLEPGGSTIECHAPDGGLVVEADRTDLRRCFENLLSNALRFAQSRIVAEARSELGEVAVTVEDDGTGLPAEGDYQRVWDERVRFHADSDRSGQGLGLAVVRELVERVGGHVAAAPSALGGARFTLRLPRRD